MTYVAHEEEKNGLTIKIELDDSGTESPLSYDDACIFAVLHRRYKNPAAKVTVHDKDGNTYDFTTTQGIQEFEKDNAADDAPWAVFPLFMYDHSGTIYRASEGGNPFDCPWDSGRVGIIALKKDEVGKPEEHPYIKQAQGMCEAYTSWANGEIYGYVIEDEDGEQLDSCWGFIGDPQGYVLEEARRQLEYCAEQRDKEELTANITHFAETITEFAQLYQFCAAN